MKNTGFTLIEILIVIAIIGIFSTFAVVNFRRNDKTNAVKGAAQTVLTGLKEAQTMALSGALLPTGQAPSQYYFEMPACQAPNPDAPCKFYLKAKVPGVEPDAVVKTVVLKETVKLSKFYSPAETAFVFFQLPRGNIILDAGNVSRLKISHTDETVAPLCVFVSKISGKIYTDVCP